MAENTTEITDVEGDETPMTSYTSESAPAGEARASLQPVPVQLGDHGQVTKVGLLLRTLEDAGKAAGVGSAESGIHGTYKLLLDVRRFESET